MRTKVLFMSLVLGCLWSCQQDETIEQTDGRIIKFTSVVIGDETLSRASGSTSIDVISMRTELDDKFTVFDLKKDTRSWGEFSKKNEVFFYAHYPRLPESVASNETRVLEGGTNDYLFGKAKAVAGQQQVCLQFKRVMAPLIVEVLDGDGRSYQGDIEVSALIKNKGVQNLKDGSIVILDEKKYTAFNRFDNGVKQALNLLPQRIEKGTPFQVRLSNGVTYTATVGEAVQLNSGESYKAVVRGARVDITIYDGSIPL